MVSGIFTPVVPVLMASGMMGAVLTILSLAGVLDANGPTCYVLNVIYDAGFCFLPIFIGYNASKKLNASPFLSMLLAAIMLHPNLTSFGSLGVEQLSVFGIGIPTVNYSKTVLPIILGVWLPGYLERFFPGCIRMEVLRRENQPDHVYIVSAWESEEAMQASTTFLKYKAELKPAFLGNETTILRTAE